VNLAQTFALLGKETANRLNLESEEALEEFLG
jgi:hypothetical protein